MNAPLMDGVPALRYFTLTATRRTGKMHFHYFYNSYHGLEQIHVVYSYYIGIDQITYYYDPVLLLLLLLFYLQ